MTTSRIEPRHLAAKQDLESLLRSLAKDGVRRLPPEDELAKILGSSRPTIRTALQALQRDGLIRRRHGAGTFINRHALQARANIVIAQSYLDHLRRCGYDAASRALDLRLEQDTDVAAKLQAQAGDDTLCIVDRLFEADGNPAVFSSDHLLQSSLTTPFEHVATGKSVFEFVRQWTGRSVTHTVAALVPSGAQNRVAELLQLEPGTPLMSMETLHIDNDDEPVAFTRAWINDRYLRFSVIRDHETNGDRP